MLLCPRLSLRLGQARSTILECRDGQVTCFNGHLPVFTHAPDDLAAFRLFTSQWISNGTATGAAPSYFPPNQF